MQNQGATGPRGTDCPRGRLFRQMGLGAMTMFGKQRQRTGFVLFFPEPIWNEERQVVRFLAVNVEAVPCAISRAALELLGGQIGLSSRSPACASIAATSSASKPWC